MGKYQPLETFLNQSEASEVSFEFNELERVLGFPLPPSARAHQAWWSNTHHNPAVRAWRRAGWRSVNVDVRNGRLTFVRDSLPVRPQRSLFLDLNTLSPAAMDMLRDQARGAGGLEEAVVQFINREAGSRRGLVEHFIRRSPKLADDSSALIREDRDAR